MKFCKYERKRKIKRRHSAVDAEMARKQLDELLVKCENEYQRDVLIKAYNVTIRP